ncbi:MAG: hypothetical protein J6J83_05340 [Oscillospiraceae bacterium]|nr:hypothetical protein [Oscillospiraceae bacterium]
MGDMGLMFYYLVVTLFSFFVVGPCILNTISLFGVQKRFAKAMVEEGVITQEAVDRIHPKKQIAGVVISVVVTAALIYLAYRTAPIGYLCAGIAQIASIMKYYRVAQYNSLTVKRFRNTYENELDTKKFNQFVNKNF